MVIAHGIFHGAEGVPLSGWVADLVLIGVPLLVLVVSVLVLEARTRPNRPEGMTR